MSKTIELKGKPLVFVESLEEADSILGEENWSYPIQFDVDDVNTQMDLDDRFCEKYKAVAWSVDGMVKYVRR